MNIDINSVDLNEDYFHFTNIKNVESILNEGLKPMVGAASKMIDLMFLYHKVQKVLWV